MSTRRFKNKFKPRLEMLSDQQESTSSDQEKIKGRWKQYTENLSTQKRQKNDRYF